MTFSNIITSHDMIIERGRIMVERRQQWRCHSSQNPTFSPSKATRVLETTQGISLARASPFIKENKYICLFLNLRHTPLSIYISSPHETLPFLQATVYVLASSSPKSPFFCTQRTILFRYNRYQTKLKHCPVREKWHLSCKNNLMSLSSSPSWLTQAQTRSRPSLCLLHTPTQTGPSGQSS